MNQYHLDGFQQDDFTFYGGTVFSKGGKNFLLGNNGCSILLDDNLMRSLKSATPSDQLMFKMVQHGLAYVPGKHMFRCEKEIEVRYFIIDLTKCCNFNCIYCFRDSCETRCMDMPILDGILQYIKTYCESHQLKHISLQMWGGEPLLELPKIRYVAHFFQDSDIKASIDIETNASLVTDEIAKELFELDIHVGVSIDGPPDLHDKQRELLSGGPSSLLVEKGIRNLQKYYGDDIGGITVITKYNFRDIDRILDYFIYHLGLFHMKFNLVRDNIHAEERKLALTTKETEYFLQELIECLDAFQCMGANFSEGNIAIRAKNLLQRSGISCCLSHGCQAGRRIVSFDYKGDVYPCEMIDFPDEKIGSVFETVPLDQQIQAAIHKKRFFIPKKEEKCQECCWWYYCGGGCSSRNRYLKMEGEIDETECLINHILYPKIIEWILDGRIA